eukprot:1161093-Pelagomonas_calceolata.AAC.11
MLAVLVAAAGNRRGVSAAGAANWCRGWPTFVGPILVRCACASVAATAAGMAWCWEGRRRCSPTRLLAVWLCMCHSRRRLFAAACHAAAAPTACMSASDAYTPD